MDGMRDFFDAELIAETSLVVTRLNGSELIPFHPREVIPEEGTAHAAVNILPQVVMPSTTRGSVRHAVLVV